MRSDLERLLREASALVGCHDVALRCQHPVLDAVYAVRDETRLVITDRGETYQYLSRRDDSTYNIDLLDEATAREICERHGVSLNASDPEMSPRIERELASTDDVAMAITDVAEAVHAIYRAATRHDLR